ncbi:MAG: type II toxin-antitoxin system VapC family toxin [Myxococcales bacterium]|nr:type II toxin-antitoxin system VapC family toxin [Myxococcales bacterium]
MIFFLEASAMVKKYIAEPGTERLETLVRTRRDLAVCRVTHVELPAALARRARAGDLSREVARRHAAQYEADAASLRIVELRPPVLILAAKLVWNHALRAFDALQLGAALHLGRASQAPLTFVAADGPLCDAAQAEGLRVERLGR